MGSRDDGTAAGGEDSLLKTIARDLKAMHGSLTTLTETVNGLETKIVTHIRGIIRQETNKFNEEIELLKGRMDNLEDKINGSQAVGRINSDFDIERSVIILNLEQQDPEDLAAVCSKLFEDAVGVQATVTRVERTRQRNPEKPALVKCQLANKDEKIAILRRKRNVKEHDDYKQVFIARMKSHEERLIELNFKTMLNHMPDGNKFRFTGSGRMVSKDDNRDGRDGTVPVPDEMRPDVTAADARNGNMTGGATATQWSDVVSRSSSERTSPNRTSPNQAPRITPAGRGNGSPVRPERRSERTHGNRMGINGNGK